MRLHRIGPIVLAAGLALGAAACSDDDGDSDVDDLQEGVNEGVDDLQEGVDEGIDDIEEGVDGADDEVDDEVDE